MKIASLLALTATLLLAACQQPPAEVQKYAGAAQGTTYHISYWTEQNTDVAAIKKSTDEEFARLDKVLSNYRPDSLIEQFNAVKSTDPQAVSGEIVDLIIQARVASEASNGCYDLTINPLFKLWGFKGDKLTPPDAATLKATLQQIGFKQLEITDAEHLRKLNPDLTVDVSSIAQGYSVKRIANLLEQQGITDYLVEVGGELQTRGKKPDGEPWRVALEKPVSEERTMQKVVTINRSEPIAIMTSGTYRHYFDVDGKRYSHILDAKTGTPVTHNTVSVTVIDDDPTKADAWSTALMCLGREAGLAAANKAGIAALFIEHQGEAFNEFSSTALTSLSTITIK
jgi:thiamine biosynthesis lipoprotein